MKVQPDQQLNASFGHKEIVGAAAKQQDREEAIGKTGRFKTWGAGQRIVSWVKRHTYGWIGAKRMRTTAKLNFKYYENEQEKGAELRANSEAAVKIAKSKKGLLGIFRKIFRTKPKTVKGAVRLPGIEEAQKKVKTKKKIDKVK